MPAQSKAIKTRIKSVRNTKKITKAMELVSAAKMRRVVSRTVAMRPYIQESVSIVSMIQTGTAIHPLLVSPQVDKQLLIVITSDKGLCGGYNAQIIRSVVAYNTSTDTPCDIICIGKKGDTAMRQYGYNVIATFEQKNHNTLRETNIISQYIVKAFTAGNYAKVVIAHTNYISALTQEAHVTQLLPFIQTNIVDNTLEYIFEPNAVTILDVVIEKIIDTVLYGMVVESAASEESARMIAMKNASDAAGEMITDLSLTYNKIRQAGITQEISEISAGMTSTH